MTPRVYFDPRRGIVLVTTRLEGLRTVRYEHVMSRYSAAHLRNQLGTMLVNCSQELDAFERKQKVAGSE